MKDIGADIPLKEACTHAALHLEQIPEHLAFQKAEIFELKSSKSLLIDIDIDKQVYSAKSAS